MIMTLHNYRLLCPSANLLHHGKVFTESVHSSFPWKAVFRGMHSHSIIKTFWLALVNWFHRKTGTWKMVNQYIVLTSFAKNLFIHSSFNIPENHFSIKPNFSVSTKHIKKMPNNHFLFLGRLSEEKGIQVLLDTFENRSEERRVGKECVSTCR